MKRWQPAPSLRQTPATRGQRRRGSGGMPEARGARCVVRRALSAMLHRYPGTYWVRTLGMHTLRLVVQRQPQHRAI